MIEELLERLEASAESKDTKFYGVTVGKVINPLDPMSLGRVQVQLPFIDSLDLQPWARVAVPMAGPFSGTYFIPNVGDEVLVAFEHGDSGVPYIIGSLWNAISRPPLPSPVPQIRTIRTLVGNQIVFEDVPPAITIQTSPTPPVPIPLPGSPTGPHQTIRISPAGVEVTSPVSIRMQVGTNTLLISPAGITLQVGSNVVNITPQGVSVAGTEIDLMAVGQAVIAGAMVRINS